MQISKKNLSDGITLTTVVTDKFKFNQIFIDFILPLESEHASENALFASVLLRGSENHPNTLSIRKELSSLYGAEVYVDIGTRGEAHVVTMRVRLLDDRCTLCGENITAKATSLISEIITSPKKENGVFDETFVESEKEKLISDIEAQINDKDEYAVNRCKEIMCENEAWGVSPLGTVADTEKITSESLFQRYEYVLSHAKIEIFSIGSLDESKTEAFARGIFGTLRRGEVPDYSTKIVKEPSSDVKNICERLPVAQGKLVMGFRTGIGGYDENYYVMRVLNCVFGSGTQSKLFRNVREKLSLCYYCFSQAYPKGVLLVASGIDSNNKEKAVNEILFQLEAIKNGAVTEEEIDDAKKLLCNSIRASGDSAVALHSYFLGNSVFGISDTPEEAMEKIRSVTAEQIVSAAAGIKPDTVYFLCGTEDKE